MKLLILFIFLYINLFSSIFSTTIVPSSIIDLSPLLPFSNSSYALLMDKSAYQLSLFQRENGKIKKVKSYNAIYGKNNGDKYFQGDSRTPEGIYFINQIIDDSELLPKYGKRAFVLNYPNPIDKLNGKTGIGIWLHSVDDPKRLKLLNDTRGCVAVSNNDIIELSNIVGITETPVIIVQKSNLITENEAKTNQVYFQNFIQNWKKAWASSNIDEYINFYSNSFYSTDKKMNKDQWKAYKSYLASSYKNIDIQIDNLNVFNFNSYVVVLFKQQYTSPNLNDTGKKMLYLEKINDHYEIVSESWYAFSKKETLTISKKE